MVSSVSVPSVEKAEAIGVKCAFLFITPEAPVINRLAGTIDLGEIQPIIGGEYRNTPSARYCFSLGSHELQFIASVHVREGRRQYCSRLAPYRQHARSRLTGAGRGVNVRQQTQMDKPAPKCPMAALPMRFVCR